MKFFLSQVRSDSITHRIANKTYDWVSSYGPKIIIAVVIFIIGQWLIRLFSKAVKKILAARMLDITLRPFIENLLQILLQVLLLMGLMQLLGIKMTLFAAFIGALGVAVGLALSGTLQNFASGVLIILLKPFRVGDNIKTQGEEGTVKSIRLFYSVITTFNNVTLIIPNSKLSNEVIFNLTREARRRIDIPVKFNYAVDYKQVHEAMERTLQSFAHSLQEPPSRIGIEKIEADGFTVSLNVWVHSHGYYDAKLLLNEKLMNELKPVIQKI